MNAMYGVSPALAASGGLAAHEAGGGMMFASAGLLGSVDLGPRWLIVASFEERRLRGDAARSPLAERRANHYLSAGAAYRF